MRWLRWDVIVAGAIALAVSTGVAAPSDAAEPAGQSGAAGAADPVAEIAKFKDEIERLKAIVPDQAHVMKDVAYHFANLWFAGRARNWPLARFYLDETRSHLKWAVRIRPTRRTAAGGEVDLRAILDGVDRTLLLSLQAAIEGQDQSAFSKGYRGSLAGCYACHQASEKPYLRLRVPDAPEGRMIEFSPRVSGR